MGWGFRKSKSLGRGLRLNLNKGGLGLSAGRRGTRRRQHEWPENGLALVERSVLA